MNLITTAEGFFGFMLLLMALIFGYEKKNPNSKIFKVIPSMLWLMILVAVGATIHLWDPNAEGVCAAQNIMYTTFLPMMLIMFMLTCDVRDILKLGPRMIAIILNYNNLCYDRFHCSFLNYKKMAS